MQTDTSLMVDLKCLVIEACQVKGIGPEQIGDEDQLINGPGPLVLTSLDAVEIAVAVERRFGVRIRDTSAAKAQMRSIKSLAHHVSQEMAKGSGNESVRGRWFAGPLRG